MSIIKNSMGICLIGASGVGKTTFGAALTVRKHLAKNKNGTISVKELKRDELFRSIKAHSDRQFPTRQRVVHKSTLSFKSPENAWATPFTDIYLFDDRGGSFDSFLDYFFSVDEYSLQSSTVNASSIIAMISSEQFFKSCPKYGFDCSPLKCQDCKEGIDLRADIDCKHLNRYAIKQLLHVISLICIKNSLPMAIAVTHSNIADGVAKQREMKSILQAYIDEEFATAPHLKPNVYFVDSKSAIDYPNSEWARSISLPVLDVILKSLQGSTLVNSRGRVAEFFHNKMFGARGDSFLDLKNTLITAIETQGG